VRADRQLGRIDDPPASFRANPFWKELTMGAVTALPHDTPLLDVVPEVLAGRAAAAIIDDTVRSHARLISQAFRTMLAEVSTPGAGEELRDIVGTLPEETVTRTICAPESCRQLLYRKEPNPEFFVESAMAEQRRLGITDAVPGNRFWSALGDFCWHPDGAFHAPALANGVIVDLFSPQGADFLRAYGNARPSEGSIDVRAIVGSLDEALAVMETVNPGTAQFFSSFVQVVIPWQDPASPRGRASLSDTRWVGAVACANVTTVNRLHLVDMLIHESVHSFLGMIEEHDPLLSDLGAVRSLRVPSPWTGTPLHPRNFLHASFVWFALRQFWRAAAGRGIVDERRAERLLNMAGSGFQSPVLWQSLADVATHLSPRAREVVPVFFEAVTTGAFD
jgi:hypothetical protein